MGLLEYNTLKEEWDDLPKIKEMSTID